MVVKSWHCDIGPGTEGIIVKRRRRGYEIEITGVFADAFGKNASETRVVFFSAKDVKRARSKPS